MSWKCSPTIGDEFQIFEESFNFNQAVEKCQDNDSTLAAISSMEEYLFVFQLDFERQSNNNFWIGRT